MLCLENCFLPTWKTNHIMWSFTLISQHVRSSLIGVPQLRHLNYSFDVFSGCEISARRIKWPLFASMEQKILEGRKSTALLHFYFYVLLCALHIIINRRVVNKYYSDLGMGNRRHGREILFLLLSLCWWSSDHFSLVGVIA